MFYLLAYQRILERRRAIGRNRVGRYARCRPATSTDAVDFQGGVSGITEFKTASAILACFNNAKVKPSCILCYYGYSLTIATGNKSKT